MRIKLRVLAASVIGLGVLALLACQKDSVKKIIQSGLAVEESEPDKLNAYPILSYMQTNSPAAPAVDGEANEDIWRLTLPYEVQTTGGANGFAPKVTLKALYDSYYLFLLAIWDDTTESYLKDMWWYGSAVQGDTTYKVKSPEYGWHRFSEPFSGYLANLDKIRIDTTKTPPDTNYIYSYKKIDISGDEDALSILWNVNSTNFLNCTSLCHGNQMNTDTKESADLWYWAAARTNPRKCADDRSLAETGFVDDTGTAPFKLNGTGTEPEFATAKDPGANVAFIYDSTATKYYATLDWVGGNRVPGYVLSWPTGSRADVRAAGKFANGKWTVEIRRRLDTFITDGTDAIFDPDADANIEFHLAVYDNARGKSHAISSGTSVLHFLQLVK